MTLPDDIASFQGNFLGKFHQLICEENQKAEHVFEFQLQEITSYFFRSST